jgi:two-component system response regulator DesR
MIAEDQTMVRQALVALLELEPDIEVGAQASDGHEVASKLREAGLQGKVVTVRNHLSSAIQKLGARNRAEAVAVARRKGWL